VQAKKMQRGLWWWQPYDRRAFPSSFFLNPCHCVTYARAKEKIKNSLQCGARVLS
jgi:hypothetical protein